MTLKLKPTNKHLAWLDNHLLELIAGFLLAFLPLYPKWPLFDALPGYIVRVRLEDFLVGLSLLVYIVQVVRGKTSINKNFLFKPIIAYLIIGLVSAISAVLVTKTVPAEAVHVGKLMLHWARRVEYMSLALVFFGAVTSKESIKRVMIIFSITAMSISLYGFGQKYLQWPVYSTMNREFSKGWRLVLTQHARVSSTFGGHYDLAAYALIALILLVSLTFVSKPITRIGLITIFVLMYTTLLLTASRTSFIAYLVAMVVLAILAFQKYGFKKFAVWWVGLMAFSFLAAATYGPLKERFGHLLMTDRVEKIVQEKIFNPLRTKPIKSIELPDDLALIYSDSDSPPTPVGEVSLAEKGSTTGLPADVYEQIPQSFPEASLSAIPVTAGTGLEGKPRIYSQTARDYGLSSAIRFDALWPRAIERFKTNPLLGSGYSTLLKENIEDFTEAESTDNDYLRALGETGLLGVISFFGIFVYVLYRTYKVLPKISDPIVGAFLSGFIAALIGLLVNALYIDIFEASKVAYTIWGLVGLAVGVVVMVEKENNKTGQKKTIINKKTRI